MNWEIYLRIFVVLVAIFATRICRGFTDPRDVFAMNSLYAALGYPPLPRWVPNGGDPCGENWLGVQCVNSNITGIVLNGLNLGGELGESLGFFASIIEIDLSNNHIGGSIPSNLPVTIRTFYLFGNQFTGSIPDNVSSLGQLSDLSFNNNHLTGVIPDAFQQFTGLINLDFSGNSLSGPLPPSMRNLSSLTTLHLENNQLSGMLDVLEDLPLTDLDIENNLFSGPVPTKLLNIPNFRRDGNPFNTTIIPSLSPPAPASSPSPSEALSPELVPGKQAQGPSVPEISHSARGGKSLTSKWIKWLVIGGFLIFIVLALGLCIFMSQCCKRREQTYKFDERHDMGGPQMDTKHNKSSLKPYNHKAKDFSAVPKNLVVKPPVGDEKDNKRSNLVLKSEAERGKDFNIMTTVSKHKEDHEIDMRGEDVDISLPPQPPLFPLLHGGSVIVNPLMAATTSTRRHNTSNVDSAKHFTIAYLQQYTDSFSQENLIGGGVLGTVYRAELPNGKLMAVKKLDTAASRQLSDEDFFELVSNLSRLLHPNIVKLVGYCVEHGQRLLVYEYCGNGTLYEALHLDDGIHKKLSWNARIRLAVQAAKALKYLHEVCQPPIVHRNFKSANVLLGDEFVVQVADCGLAPLLSSNSMTELQGNGYGAPELELGSYTYQSDVYSFGVVMLELLTGRKSYDRTRPRGEQFLVRWAIPRLHDIDALSKMVDPSLNGAYVSKSLSRFADIISLCLQLEPEFRPPMSEIVQNLLQMIQRDP